MQNPNEMKNPLLSVIITTYHRDFPTLKEAIDSVEKQSYSPIEILIVDDNGKDMEYSDMLTEGLKKEAYTNVVYIKLPKNSGAQVARNEGISKSKGEFIGFLDDDDLWTENKAELQIKLFEDERVGLAFGKGLIFFGNDITNTKPYFNNNNFIKEPSFHDMLEGDYVGSTSQVIIRRSCFDVCGNFDTSFKARQDYEMWLRISKNGFTLSGVEEVIFYHRMHDGEQISKSPKRSLTAYMGLYSKYKEDFDAYPPGKIGLYMKIAFVYKTAGKLFGFLRFAWKAFWISPKVFLFKVKNSNC